MNINTKLILLKKIYKLYDRFAAGLSVACKRFCAHCCTCNVVMTTLEGYIIADHLIRSGQSKELDKLLSLRSKQRFQPKMTTNMLADLCAKGGDIPAEQSDATWGNCPFLENSDCPIYPVRPFGCRCFLSKRNCGNNGYADVDSFVMSVNSVFLQFLEHVDADGYSGNLIDILNMMRDESNRKLYCHGVLKRTGTTLIPNRGFSVLFVPPEHRSRLKPILTSLQQIKAP